MCDASYSAFDSLCVARSYGTSHTLTHNKREHNSHNNWTGTHIRAPVCRQKYLCFVVENVTFIYSCACIQHTTFTVSTHTQHTQNSIQYAGSVCLCRDELCQGAKVNNHKHYACVSLDESLISCSPHIVSFGILRLVSPDVAEQPAAEKHSTDRANRQQQCPHI